MVANLIAYDEFKEQLNKQGRPEEDVQKIERAYAFAYKLHEGQYRVSEEPYIIHPIEVAKILLGLRVDTNTIVAAFLHDILEDTDTKPEEIKEIFGDDVLKLVQGVTKLGKLQFQSKEERQAENFRRMFVAMAEDIRIIFLKLADRLHNMRTLSYMAPAKQKRIAQETLDIFAPLANRLGIGKMKSELEDLSLRYIDPEKYYDIAKQVATTRHQRDKEIASLIEVVEAHLKENHIEAKIYGRAKHYYSICSKMERLNVTFDQLYDISAIRIIVKDEKDCYGVLGIIHGNFKPIPGRFKDYIAMPKANGYQSLHTTVIGPKNKPFEIQIRTKVMHEIAEYGVAAHWKYKEAGSIKVDKEDAQFAWMRKLVELDKDSGNAKEFVESVKLDLFSDQVFAFTPMGDVLDLPAGSTPVDFAYRIHTEIGHRTVGALINGRIVTLDTKLKNGDIVEILTSKQQMPKIDWLNFVVTKSASSKIRLWFKKNKREDNIGIGRMQLESALTKAVFDECLKNGAIDEAASDMNYKSANDLFAALGYGETTLHKVLNKIKKPSAEENKEELIEQKIAKRERRDKKDDIVGLEGMLWNLAKCCSPIPGEPIVGVVTRSKGVTVHRLDCKSLFDIEPERMMDVHWADGVSANFYQAHIRVECQDKVGVLKDMITRISDAGVNIVYTNTHLKEHKFGIIDIGVELNNIETLKKVISNIQSIPEILSVRRLQQRGWSEKYQGRKPSKKTRKPKEQNGNN